MADEIYFYEWLRPVKHYKSMYDAGNDPWGSEGGTYDYPVVTRDDTNVYFLYRDGTGRPWIEIYPPGGGVKYLTSDDFDNPSKWGVPGFGGDRLVRYEDGGGLDSGPIPGAWRSPEEGEEPLGRVESHVEEARPLEETTPLFGPQEEPVLEPEHDPWDQPREGHWDPVGLRWVYDEPTMKSAGILDDDHTHTLGERRLAADQESSVADHKADLGEDVAGPLRSGHWDPAALRFVYDEPTTMRSAGILGHDAHTGPRDESRPAADEESSDDGHTDTREESSDHGHTGPRDESRPAADEESSVADHKADLGEDVAGPLRSGHWDPAALRWVPDEPTSSVGKVLGDESTQVPVEGGGAGGSAEGEGEPPPPVEPPSSTDPWDQPREGQPTMRSVGKVLGDESTAQDTGEGSATQQGVDPSVPFDPDTTPTSVDEGTAAAPFSVDSTSFEGSTAARGFDPSGPLDRADPNLQSLDTSLFDLNAPGPTLDPALFDEAEPGPTLDPGLLDHDAPGPTLDANRLDPSAPGHTLDEAQLERASERPNSVEEQPADVTGLGDTDPRAMEEPAAHPEPSTPRHDDHDDQLDVG